MSDIRISSTTFRPDHRPKVVVAKSKAKKTKVKEDKPRRRQGIDRYA